MENKGDFFAGIVVGTVLGTLLGVLFAPASGQETRQKVAEKGKEVSSLAAEKMKEKSEYAMETAKEVISQLKDKLPGCCETEDSIEIKEL